MLLAHQAESERTARDLPFGRGARSRTSQRIAGGGDRYGCPDRRPRASRTGLIVRHRIRCAAQVMGRRRPRYPVIFLDTGWLFERRLPIATPDRDVGAARRPFDQTARGGAGRARIRIANCGSPIRCLLPDPEVELSSGHWRRSVVDQRAQTLSGRPARAIPVVEDDGVRLKFIIRKRSRGRDRGDLRARKLPRHPLAASGYLSVGVHACHQRTSPDEDARAGAGASASTECAPYGQGLHRTMTPASRKQ